MRILLSFIFSSILLLGLPAAGIFLSGQPVEQYMEFPPLTRYVRHAGPSWLVFAVLFVSISAFLYPFLKRFLEASPGHGSLGQDQRSFPWWGKGALFICVISWVLAWTRFSWFRPFQPYTFIPLWFSFVFLVNGLSHWRTGSSLLERAPVGFVLLFPASSIFWWYFEYLNRFVQNWYYVGIDDFSTIQYVVTASVSFSTVLPAVLSVNEFLKGFGRFENAFEDFAPLNLRTPGIVAACALLLSSSGLIAIGILPDILFPLLWTAPLIIVTAINFFLGIPTVFEPLGKGSWTPVCRLAASGLICGIFWEMWNYFSYAKWIYSIPFVSQLKIFEMPLLGYAGYLPFGLECAVAGSFVMGLQDILESRAPLMVRKCSPKA